MDFFYNTASNTPLPCFCLPIACASGSVMTSAENKNNANATKNTSLSTQTLAKVFN